MARSTRRFLITVGIVVWLWIVALAYVTDFAPRLTYQQRWTACMTEQRSAAMCSKRVH